LAARIAEQREIPLSTVHPDLPSVPMTALTSAKVGLYQAMRTKGWSRAELGRRLGWQAPQVDRLLDLNHVSPFDQIEKALRVMQRRLAVEVQPVDQRRRPFAAGRSGLLNPRHAESGQPP
jgi:antitoxin HicB